MERDVRDLALQVLLVFVFLMGTSCRDPNTTDQATIESGSSESETAASSKNKPWSGETLNNWNSVFAEMKQVLELTTDEEQQLKRTYEEHVATLQAWYSKHGPTIADGDRAALNAARNKDLSKLRKIKNEVAPLKTEGLAMHKQMDAAVRNCLSDANRSRWLGHRLASRFFELADTLDLSEEQKTQVREQAIEVAKRVDKETSPQSAGILELEKVVEARVLDEKQQSLYEDVKNQNKMRSLKTYSTIQPSR